MRGALIVRQSNEALTALIKKSEISETVIFRQIERYGEDVVIAALSLRNEHGVPILVKKFHELVKDGFTLEEATNLYLTRENINDRAPAMGRKYAITLKPLTHLAKSFYDFKENDDDDQTLMVTDILNRFGWRSNLLEAAIKISSRAKSMEIDSLEQMMEIIDELNSEEFYRNNYGIGE